MANPSVQNDHKSGPDWPLGFIKVATPGTPVSIMSLVDSGSVNAPGTGTPDQAPSPGGARNPTSSSDDYTVRCQQIIFQAYKPGASHGTQRNTGNVYIMRVGAAGGDGSRDDTGSIVATLEPGQTFTLASAPMVNNVWSPYRYKVDGDNANDGVFVALVLM